MKRLRLGVAGLGTVGKALMQALDEKKNLIARRAQCDIEISAVSARRRRDIKPEFVAHAVDLASRDDVDCVVELIGGGEGIARTLVEAALENGKHVITANKALLARHGMGLAALAEDRGVALNYEAAIAGAVPIVKTLRESRAGESIGVINGILNGTCNYILHTMEKTGRSFDAVLAEAQEKGYAESDPGFDIHGHDAAHKLTLLASLAFGCTLSDISAQSIASICPLDIKIAGDMGYAIRLIAHARRQQDIIECYVRPALLLKSRRLAQLVGTRNAVQLESASDTSNALFLEGEGAGAHPTASAVCADIVDVARGHILPVFGVPARHLKPMQFKSEAQAAPFYIRLFAYDRAGSMAAIMKEMAAADISLTGIRQSPFEHEFDPDQAAIALITHHVPEARIAVAVERLSALDAVAGQPIALRIEG